MLERADVRDRLLGMSTVPVANAPQQFAGFIRFEREKWAQVIQDAGIRIE